MALSRSQKQDLTKLRNSGASDLGVGLDVGRLNYLLTLITQDLDHDSQFPELPNCVSEMFDRVDYSELYVEGVQFNSLYERLLRLDPDADTYLFCLGSLLKARLKYERILQAQPIPTVEQIGPRSLLQFGHMQSSALAAFLFWRKWIYDIDNRAGQETGYLFEPIVARSIGGVPYGAKNSPVRRNGTGSGRQVDCILDNDNGEQRAYELKLRVTIAASGQGRWSEELSFPHDCKESGFKPVFIVFDDTENEKLAALCSEFRKAGGETYVGPAAWAHLEQKAGPTMGKFLEKYVRQPINEILGQAPEALPQITFGIENSQLIVSVNEDQLIVARSDSTSSASRDLSEEIAEQTSLLPEDIDE
jgi:hypothetical protein